MDADTARTLEYRPRSRVSPNVPPSVLRISEESVARGRGCGSCPEMVHVSDGETSLRMDQTFREPSGEWGWECLRRRCGRRVTQTIPPGGCGGLRQMHRTLPCPFSIFPPSFVRRAERPRP